MAAIPGRDLSLGSPLDVALKAIKICKTGIAGEKGLIGLASSPPCSNMTERGPDFHTDAAGYTGAFTII
jgi:hypothetical protein